MRTRNRIAPLLWRALRRLAFLVSAIPLGTAWFVLLVTGWSLGLSLLITLLGIPVLIGLAYAVRACGVLERALAGALLDVRVAPPAWSLRGDGRGRGGRGAQSAIGRLRAWARDPLAWRDQAYLLLRFVLGLPLAVGVISVVGAGGSWLAAPTYYYAGDSLDFGVWDVDTLGEALLLVPAGAVVLVLGLVLADRAGALWIALARLVLGDAGAAAATSPARPGLAPGAGRRLAAHAAVYAVLQVALILIWLFTTPGGYFWPAWTLLPLGLVLALHAVPVLVAALAPDARRGVVAVARHGAVVILLVGALIGVWALTTPGGYFWPAWVALGLGIPLALHAVRVAAGGGEREELAERIDVLTTSRAGAVDAQAAELRRIERDLHDGAQARLVALAMDLGLAREKLGGAPGGADALVAGAHEEAKRALVELRDLARGIHPAVLSDRGLAAALGSLAGTSRIPVELDVDLPDRLEAPLEAAAYFVVSEALANAAKHSGAGLVRVEVRRRGDVLAVRVADDGAGGADPDGQGLTGLRRRVEAHDGRLDVESPPGGGTALSAELPCGS